MKLHYKGCGHSIVDPRLPAGFGDFGGKCPNCRPTPRPPPEPVDTRRAIWERKLASWRSLSADR